MNQHTLLDTVRGNGLEARAQADEVLVHHCVFCGNDRWNLELNAQKGVYSCWACNASGRLDQFLREQFGIDARIDVDLSTQRVAPTSTQLRGDEYKPAHLVPTASQYLKRRGFGTGEILRYDIAVCISAEDAFYGRIVLPLYEYHSGAEIGRVGRAYGGERPKYRTEGPAREVVGWRAGCPRDFHVLVEGPFDGLSVHRAGYAAAVMQGTGADVEEWAALTGPHDRIAIMLDGNARDEARRLFHRIRPIRSAVEVVELPEQLDPADLRPEAVRALLSTS